VAPIGTIRTCYHHAGVAGIPDAIVAMVMTLRAPAGGDPLDDAEL
jgi:hypothetical protein